MAFLSVKDLHCQNKTVLLRVDFNVPFDAPGRITDLTRIQESLPTIRFLLDQSCSLVLLSHRGRPKGRDPLYTLKPCAEALSSFLGQKVLFAADCLGEETEKKISQLKPRDVLLLENVRFYPAEEKPEIDPSFALALSRYGKCYVDDAFSAAHRSHSSIVPLAKLFPNQAAGGFLLEKESKILGQLFHSPKPPFHLIIGGAKISSKLRTIQALAPKAHSLYIGGGMAFTFLKALGYSIGHSLYEPEFLAEAEKIIHLCEKKKIPLYLPIDLAAGQEFKDTPSPQIFSIGLGIPDNWLGMDIGPQTVFSWEKHLKTAGSIFWNGPLGVFEFPHFAKGTYDIATYLSSLSSDRIIGGGDSIAAIQSLGLANRFTHLSTGGGASLEFLEKGTLPGIEALTQTIN